MTRHAHGKVILLGEHAVVYGVPAIAAGIDRGATASAARADAAELVIGEQRLRPDDGSDLGKAFGAVLTTLEAPALRVELALDIPAGCGLGASAAMGVATARAVLEALGGDDDTERVLAAATAWEGVFHGNPSGIDAAAAALGGCILFSRADGATPLPVARPLHLAVALAGPPASTRAMVESVARLRARRRDLVDKTLEGIHSLVRNARLCIEVGDVVGLGKLIDLNQMLLAGLFLSTDEIERACHLARDAGALGAKLTGAGGGGAVIALVDANPAPVLEAWKQNDIDGFATVIRDSEAP